MPFVSLKMLEDVEDAWSLLEDAWSLLGGFDLLEESMVKMAKRCSAMLGLWPWPGS